MHSEQHETEPSLSAIDFRPSTFGSIGIELELPILDRDSSALVAGAKSVLNACADDGIDGVGAELMQSMLEIRTWPCANVTELAGRLLPVLRRVRNISTSLGFELALLGTHPFQRARDNAVFPDTRFENTWLKLAWMTYYRVVFGLHIHVGMTSGDQAIRVMNQMIPYLPHLIALSSNSPFWQGVDTGFASCRTALYALVPHAGIPPTMGRWRDFRTYCSVMSDSGAMKSIKDIKWDVRPRPDLGTLEFRICDMPYSVDRILTLSALTRGLAIVTQRLLEARPKAGRADSRRQWISIENRWLAARYGLNAVYIRTPTGKRRPLRQDLTELLPRVEDVARDSGDARYLAPLRDVSRVDSGADRQRRAYRDAGDWGFVMRELIAQFARELDKEAGARSAPAPVV
jgi:carboxylate-amine ligase